MPTDFTADLTAGHTLREPIDCTVEHAPRQPNERVDSTVNPMRCQRRQALARRAAAQGGAIGERLEHRLAMLARPSTIDSLPADTESAARTPVPGALAQLLAHLAEASAERSDTASRRWPELAALDDFRAIWLRVRADSQLRTSLQQAPENAGPLNSAKLVHRSLSLMRELSPAYLRHFLAHVDGLMWLQQFDSESAATAPSAPGARPRRRARGRKATVPGH